MYKFVRASVIMCQISCIACAVNTIIDLFAYLLTRRGEIKTNKNRWYFAYSCMYSVFSIVSYKT